MKWPGFVQWPSRPRRSPLPARSPDPPSTWREPDVRRLHRLAEKVAVGATATLTSGGVAGG